MSRAIFSNGEQEQLLQTVEMFEVITQASPNDVQSLEILKEAYTKLGRIESALSTTRRLGEAYMLSGQFSAATIEFESVLKANPGDPEASKLLAEVGGKPDSAPAPQDQDVFQTADGNDLRLDVLFGQAPTLMATEMTRFDHSEQQARSLAGEIDGNDAFAKFLIQQNLAPEDVVSPALARVKRLNEHLEGAALAGSLLDEVTKSHVVEMESLLVGILERTKFAYVPLEYYEVDRQVVKMLPENLTLGRLIVPFDILSRTVMVAMANPFDALGKEAVQHLLDYNIQWHLASPAAIVRVLRATYNLDARD
jgi:hypothetical protein